jgi:2-methylcitrate dehydratase PrpD
VAGAESLSEGLAALLARPVDADTRRRAALHVLDWAGCALLGATAEAGRVLLSYGRAQAPGPSAVIGSARREAGVAAFVNGGLANLFEMDDLHRLSIVHPGPVVVPAALALAEREGVGGDAFLDAVVRGYEAAIRIGSALGQDHYEYWYNTSTCGVFGAAAACADLLGLDRAATVDALGQAGGQASGLWQCRLEPTMSKQLYTARAAQSGLLAADLAGHGLKGAKHILEGEKGFFAATSPEAEPGSVLAAPDEPWNMWATSLKPWPACRHAHPAIEAALELREGLDMAALEGIEVTTYRQAIGFCDNPEPVTAHDARFSLQHCVAVTLLDGAPGLDAFAPEAIGRADVAALRQRVRLVEDAEYSAAFPRRNGAQVAVEANGTRREAAIRAVKGDPENPMSEAETKAKARTQMAAAGLSEDAIEALVKAIEALPDGGKPSDVGALLA